MSTLEELQKDECELQMTPMIDVTFLLLIFFMCTIKFKTLEGKLSAYLPKDVGVNTTEATPIEKVEIVIEVVNEGVKVFPKLHPREGQPWDGTGRFVYRPGTRKLVYKVGPLPYENTTALRKRLIDLKQADAERKATIDARAGTVYGDVVPVLDACIQADFTDVTFLGAPPEKKKS
jgi:biopolymer transport protein ExbD